MSGNLSMLDAMRRAMQARPVPAPITTPVARPFQKKEEEREEKGLFSREQLFLIGKLFSDTTKEVECSIGRILSRNESSSFIPDLESLLTFDHLKDVLTERYGDPTVVTDVVEVSNSDNVRRVEVDGKFSFQRKIRDYESAITDDVWGWRISSSTEKNIGRPDEFFPDIKRKRERYSFDVRGTRVDMTVVSQTNLVEQRRLQAANPKKKIFIKPVNFLEVEVERIDTSLTVEEFVKVVDEIYSIKDYGLDVSDKVKREVAYLHNKVLGVTPRGKSSLGGGYWSKPIALGIDHLLQRGKEYGVTIKLDGERRIIVLTEKVMMSVWSPGEFFVIGRGESGRSIGEGDYRPVRNTILDCEYLNVGGQSYFYIFDIVIYDGKDVRSYSLEKRLKMIRDMIGGLTTLVNPGIIIKAKKFYLPDDEGLSLLYNLKSIKNDTKREKIDLYKRIDACLSEEEVNDRITWTTAQSAFASMLEDYVRELSKLPTYEELKESKPDLLKGFRFSDIVYVLKTWGLGEKVRTERSTSQLEISEGKSLKVSRKELPETLFKYIEELLNKRFGESVMKDLGTDFFKMKGEEIKHPTDGIILQPLGDYYKQALKWKPESKLTIDFRVRRDNDEEVSLLISTKNGEKPFIGTKRYSLGEGYRMKDVTLRDGMIGEFSYANGEFVFHRERKEKTSPNFIETAVSTWHSIHNPLREETVRGHSLQVMRRWHNTVKTNILSREVGKDKIIVDIGSGRGGDLSHWRKAGIRRIYAVEPNKENREEFKRRMYDMKDVNNIKIIGKNFQDRDGVLKKIEPEDKDNIDAVVSFFSSTFFYKDKETFQGFLDTLSALRPAKFVCIVLDGSKVVEKMKKGKIVNQSFSIVKGKESEGPFGNSITTTIFDKGSMVKDTEEYLFDFTHFATEMKKIGYSLKKGSDYFLTSDVLSEEASLFSELNRRFVFVKSKKKFGKAFDPFTLSEGESVELPNIFYPTLTALGVDVKDSLIRAVLRSGVGEWGEKYLLDEDATVKKLKKKLGEVSIRSLSDFLKVNILLLAPAIETFRKIERVNGVLRSVNSVTDKKGKDVVIIYSSDSLHYSHVFIPSSKKITKEVLESKVKSMRIYNPDSYDKDDLTILVGLIPYRKNDVRIFNEESKLIREINSYRDYVVEEEVESGDFYDFSEEDELEEVEEEERKDVDLEEEEDEEEEDELTDSQWIFKAQVDEYMRKNKLKEVPTYEELKKKKITKGAAYGDIMYVLNTWKVEEEEEEDEEEVNEEEEEIKPKKKKEKKEKKVEEVEEEEEEVRLDEDEEEEEIKPKKKEKKKVEEDILDKLTDSQLEFSGRLSEYLEKKGKDSVSLEKIMKKSKVIGDASEKDVKFVLDNWSKLKQ